MIWKPAKSAKRAAVSLVSSSSSSSSASLQCRPSSNTSFKPLRGAPTFQTPSATLPPGDSRFSQAAKLRNGNLPGKASQAASQVFAWPRFNEQLARSLLLVGACCSQPNAASRSTLGEPNSVAFPFPAHSAVWHAPVSWEASSS